MSFVTRGGPVGKNLPRTGRELPDVGARFALAPPPGDPWAFRPAAPFRKWVLLGADRDAAFPEWRDGPPAAARFEAEPPSGWLLEERLDGTLAMRRGSPVWGELWTLGPGFLKIESTVVGVRRSTEYRDCRLEIRKGGGGRSVSDFTLFAIEGSRKTTALAADSFEDEVRRLAVFVSARTGWPLTTAFYGGD